ncbi:MAG: hypothetical protein AB1609_16070 [Bacillota bacterium]
MIRTLNRYEAAYAAMRGIRVRVVPDPDSGFGVAYELDTDDKSIIAAYWNSAYAGFVTRLRRIEAESRRLHRHARTDG